MVSPRKGDWIQTFSGRKFWPLDPRPEEIHLIDIAAGLAKECRYGGQCLRFYTVAEHSVLMARKARRTLPALPARARRALLLHDGSEGLGLRDIPRPIKGDLTNYREIEAGIMHAIAVRFDFDWPMSPILKGFDEAIGLTEEGANMAPKPDDWRTQQNQFGAEWPLDVDLEYWLPDRAFVEFMFEATQVGLL